MSVLAYVDTSVYGGAFDSEFATASLAFFDLVRTGRFGLLTSDVVRQEIDRAPRRVAQYFERFFAQMTLVPFDLDVLSLRDAYVGLGIVGTQWADDAGHVAAATVGGAELIVSWNFKHIVHYDKIRLYNAVNALHGYRSIEIRSPLEVIDYDDK